MSYSTNAILRLIGKPLIIEVSQQAAENCLCLDLDIRFGIVDICECLQPENTNVQATPSNGNQKSSMIFNRVSFTKMFSH